MLHHSAQVRGVRGTVRRCIAAAKGERTSLRLLGSPSLSKHSPS
jgi:hypothetical protein